MDLDANSDGCAVASIGSRCPLLEGFFRGSAEYCVDLDWSSSYTALSLHSVCLESLIFKLRPMLVDFLGLNCFAGVYEKFYRKHF